MIYDLTQSTFLKLGFKDANPPEVFIQAWDRQLKISLSHAEFSK